MLTPTLRDTIQGAVEDVVDTLGVPMTWQQTKDPQGTADVVGGFRTINWDETEIINAYGIGAKIFTIKVSDVPVIEKFDRITVLNENYTIDAVSPVHLNGIHIFHKAIVKGK